ncbi:MAG: AMIN-like domain-containing (lipo)protein, partial [Actinomycetota bacterium]
MRNTAAPTLLALALLVGATGCGDDWADDRGDDADPTVAPPPSASGEPTTRTPTATSSATPETSTPPFTPHQLSDDGGHGSGAGLGVTGVRTFRQSGYDRVVFDLGGTGTPGWRVEYTTRPTAEGSGDPVTLHGTVFLHVILRGVGLPYDTGLAP